MQKIKLICKLTKPVIIDGYFVPKGSPVSIVRWTSNERNSIEVDCSAHLYYGDKYDHAGNIIPSIGKNFTFNIEPEFLEYSEVVKFNSYE